MAANVQNPPPKDYNSYGEFKNLSRPHQAIVVTVSIFLAIFTLGLAIQYAIPSLIGRLRKLELKDGSDQAKAAEKANLIAQDKLAQNVDGKEQPELGDEIDGEIPPELEVEWAIDAEQEALKKSFWDDCKFVEKIIADLKVSGKKGEKIEAHQVCDKYCEYKRKMDNKYELDVLQKSLIHHEIEELLKDLEDPIKFPCAIDDKFELVTEKTIADGSCGFHALVGEPNQDGYYICDAIEERKKFCKYLQQAFDKKQLPPKIETALENYFLDPDDAPNFTNLLKVKKGLMKPVTVNLLKDVYKKDYKKLSIKEQDKRKKDFKYDKRVFEAYLHYIGKNSTYLLQDELEAVAEFYDVRVRLFQRGWGDDLKLAEGILNEKGKEEVIIYYKMASKHYERAKVQPIAEKKPDAAK